MDLPVVAVYDANILYPAPLRDLIDTPWGDFAGGAEEAARGVG